VATGWRKVGIIVAAFAVFGAAVVFAFIVIDGGSEPKPPQPAQDPFDSPTKGWSELAAPPEVRCCAATGWTGSELLIWGGHIGQSDKSVATGMIYDAAKDAWTEMPASPLGPRSLPGGVWTGREFLVWGGADFSNPAPYERYSDGAAFDPAAGTWRMLPPAPIDAREPLAVWTGKEMIVWGSQDREDRKVDGAAYDPAMNSWRPIADAPIELTDAAASWTGKEMIVFGAALHGGNIPESSSAIGAAYDPTSDTWRTIAASDINTNANDSVWIGDRLLAWDYNLVSQTYDPDGDRWTNAGDVPTDECEDTPSTVFAGAAYGQLCGDLVTFNSAQDRWRLLEDPATTFFPLELFGAGDTFLVSGVTGKFGQGDDWKLFAYRAGEAGAPEPTTGGAQDLTSYADPLGWRVDHPLDWTVTPIETRDKVAYSGAAFSNVDPGVAPPNSATPSPIALDPSTMPSDAVEVVITHRAGGPGPDRLSDDTRLPVTLDGLGCPLRSKLLCGGQIRGNGLDYSIEVRRGADASDEDIAAAEALVASIRFPALQNGDVAAGLTSLGPTEEFKAGRGTPTYVSGRLGVVYVMRGPNGIYVLDLDPDGCGEGENDTWDPETLQIWIQCPAYLRTGDVRYDRFGQPDPRNAPEFQTPLTAHPVITAWDGTLLVDADTIVGGLARSYWP
jgi:hypothetical protein